MTRQKHTTRSSRSIDSNVRENKLRESVEILVDQDIRKIDIGRNRGIVDQVSSKLIAQRLVTMIPTTAQSKERRKVNDPCGIPHDPTQIFPRRQINVADSRSGEILSLENSIIREVHYSAQDAQTWLLDSSATFHITSNME